MTVIISAKSIVICQPLCHSIVFHDRQNFSWNVKDLGYEIWNDRKAYRQFLGSFFSMFARWPRSLRNICPQKSISMEIRLVAYDFGIRDVAWTCKSILNFVCWGKDLIIWEQTRDMIGYRDILTIVERHKLVILENSSFCLSTALLSTCWSKQRWNVVCVS